MRSIVAQQTAAIDAAVKQSKARGGEPAWKKARKTAAAKGESGGVPLGALQRHRKQLQQTADDRSARQERNVEALLHEPLVSKPSAVLDLKRSQRKRHVVLPARRKRFDGPSLDGNDYEEPEQSAEASAALDEYGDIVEAVEEPVVSIAQLQKLKHHDSDDEPFTVYRFPDADGEDE